MNRFFLLLAGIGLSVLLYFHFTFFNEDVQIPDSSKEINSVVEVSHTLNAELDMLIGTLDFMIQTENSVKPYFELTVRKLGTNILQNVERLASECPENIGERLREFAGRIRRGTVDIFVEKSEGSVPFNVLKFRREIWTLKNLVLLGTRKIREKESDRAYNLRKISIERKKNFFLAAMIISFLLFFEAIFLYLRLKKIGKIVGTENNVSPSSVSARINKIKNDVSADAEDVQKKLFREQVVNRRKSALLDMIPAGIISTGPDDEITFVNKKIKSWFDFNEEIIGEHINKILTKLDIEKFNEGKLVIDGDCYWVTVHEELNETSVVLRNITEQENLARKLLDSERLVSIGEMASRITHEIRNPLSTIKLNSEYMVENISEMDQGQVVSSMELVVKEVKRLESITEKYMNLVKYRSSAEVESETSLPLDLVQLISFHTPEFGKRKIDLTVNAFPQCELAITLSSFKEVLLNLLKNSWEELESGGKVQVSVETEGRKAVIKVEDSGRGIPDDEKEAVFKNFYTKKPGGTGIGLSHSRKLAEEAGGHLAVVDSMLGGACFVLELPLRLTS